MTDTTTPNTDDWPTTRAKFQAIFGELVPPVSPTMNLRGVNFVTDQFLGRVVVDGEPVEIATGWFLDHRVFGVTYNRLPGGAPDPRDTAAPSLEAVADLLGITHP